MSDVVHVTEQAQDEINFAPLRDYFGIERPDLEMKNDLRVIDAWAREGGAESKGDIMQVIKRLEMRLGAPPTGERRIPRIVNYLKLDSQIGELMKQQSSFIN